MLATSVLLFGIAWLPIAQCVSYWTVSTVLNEKYSDAPGGQCTYSSARGSPLCRSNWRKNNTIKSERLSLPHISACTYYTNTITYICYKTEPVTDSSDTTSQSCIRKRPFYVMTKDCFTHWLQWGLCSKSCGGGTRIRYKFTKKDVFNSQIATCNSHPCPSWSSWSPVSESCDESCSRVWNRTCTYQGNTVNDTMCSTEDAYISVQLRPCPVSECQSFVKILPDVATTTVTKFRTTAIGEFPDTTALQLAKNLSVIDPRLSFRNDENVKGASKGNLGSGIGIGFAIATVLFVIAAICSVYVYRKIKDHELGKSLGGQHAVSTLPEHHTNGNLTGVGNNRGSVQRAAAPVARISPSAIYLEPSLSPRHRSSLVPCSSKPNVPPNPEVDVYQQSERILPEQPNALQPSMSQSLVIGATEERYVDSETAALREEDPVYADIPAFESKCGFSDDFTSDEFDSCDELDQSLHGVPQQNEDYPSYSPEKQNSRPYSQSFVQGTSNESKEFSSTKIRRSATENYSGLSNSEDRRLRNLGPAPQRPIVQRSNTNAVKTSNTVQAPTQVKQQTGRAENRYSRPFKLKKMPNLNEGSRENITEPGLSDATQINVAPNKIPQRFVFDRPASRRKSSGSSGAGSIDLRARHPSPPRTPFSQRHSSPSIKAPPPHSPPPPPLLETAPGRAKRTSLCSSGSVSADGEFGIRMMPNRPGHHGERLGSYGSMEPCPSLPEDSYREPADANLPLIEDAYNLYNLPYKPNV
uniref:uncharacterized protein LOC108949447 n=1 Tax=Ciona intestinalis TaxID=7719 RepID=UPI00089DB7F3|nr:uncharacterized protein LOC108949447 [Ciona intestinalis]|eukprot:XP_018667195.1 uncharacterized protein LOC108949447 [Ciona intestinalis]